jgi:hypothetical protein
MLESVSSTVEFSMNCLPAILGGSYELTSLISEQWLVPCNLRFDNSMLMSRKRGDNNILNMVYYILPFHTLRKPISLFFLPCTLQFVMSKRASSSKNEPQAKRTRLPAGFRLARPVPSGSQPSSSSNSSLFVTVSANSRRRGALTGENRLIPSTLNSSEPPSSSVAQPPVDSQPAAPDDHEGHSGTQVEAGEMPPPETEANAKSKRKRYTTTAVRNYFNSFLKCIPS